MTLTLNEPVLILTNEEAKELQRFLFSVGYISYEHFESIHALSRKIDAYLIDNSRNSNRLSEETTPGDSKD